LALFQPHAALDRVFSPGALSLGFVLPINRPGRVAPDPDEQLQLAALADELGFAALWVRDVPLNSPDYPDPVEHLEPWVHLGALAAVTRQIALVTGAIVSPLRHPLHVAKAALSVDRLSKGRMILGLGSGDRPAEFQAFGLDVADAPERFRQHWATIESLLSGHGQVDASGATADPAASVLPRPTHGHVPMLAVGSAGQTIGWVARNANGWATYYRPLDKQKDRYAMWASAVEKAAPAGAPVFACAMALELLEDPKAPAEPLGLGLRVGRNGLVEELLALRDLGAGHVMFNIVGDGRSAQAVLRELSSEVTPRLS
jgi:luciferase-type oxidoreductase